MSQGHNFYLSAAKGGQIVQKGCARDPVCSGVCVSRSHTMPYDKISIFKLGKFLSKCLFWSSSVKLSFSLCVTCLNVHFNLWLRDCMCNSFVVEYIYSYTMLHAACCQWIFTFIFFSYFRIVKLHRDYVRKILHVLMKSHYFFYWSWLHWCNLNSKMAF